MSTIYRKYSFATEADYNKAVEALKVEPIEGVEQPQIEFTAMPIICKDKEAVYNEEGIIIEEAVYNPNYNVDIIWEGEEPKLFVDYQVWPNGIGQHIVAGWESIYEADRKVALNIVEPKIELK